LSQPAPIAARAAPDMERAANGRPYLLPLARYRPSVPEGLLAPVSPAPPVVEPEPDAPVPVERLAPGLPEFAPFDEWVPAMPPLYELDPEPL
jgi:hypothetical protein